jgi:hypothetical protein
VVGSVVRDVVPIQLSSAAEKSIEDIDSSLPDGVSMSSWELGTMSSSSKLHPTSSVGDLGPDRSIESDL